MNFKNLIDLEAPIIPGKSIGNISLDMNKKDLLDFLHTSYLYKDKDVKIELIGYTLIYIYIYEGAIQIRYDIRFGDIYSVLAGVGYKGGVLNQLYVGDTLEKAISFDNYKLNYPEDGYMYFDNYPGLMIPLPLNYLTSEITEREMQKNIEWIGIFNSPTKSLPTELILDE